MAETCPTCNGDRRIVIVNQDGDLYPHDGDAWMVPDDEQVCVATPDPGSPVSIQIVDGCIQATWTAAFKCGQVLAPNGDVLFDCPEPKAPTINGVGSAGGVADGGGVVVDSVGGGDFNVSVSLESLGLMVNDDGFVVIAP